MNLLFDKSKTWIMFNKIAKRYDLANRLLSFGRDVAWRRRLVNCLDEIQSPGTVLDLGTGTGDVAIAIGLQRPDLQVIGVDPADQMLAVAKAKILSTGCRVTFQLGSASQIPIPDATVSAATMAFAIRNVPDVSLALRELYRVIHPGGVVAIMEFSVPKPAVVRWGYLAYFRWILPALGGMISGDAAAYRYLNQSVEAFPYGDSFLLLMKTAGFKNVHTVPLTFGVASIYIGHR